MKTILGNKGVTLLELMIVVAIIGLMAVIAIPSYMSMMPHLRLKGAVRDVSDVLQTARMKAIAKNKTYIVKFDYDNELYEMGPQTSGVGYTKEQDSGGLDWKGINLIYKGSSAQTTEVFNCDASGSTHQGFVRFDSDGSAKVDNSDADTLTGAVYIRNSPVHNNEECRVCVSEMTGKIKVQKLQGTSWVD